MNRTVNYQVRVNDDVFAEFNTLREARAYSKSAEFLEQANGVYGLTYGVQIISVATTLKELTFFSVDGSNEEESNTQSIIGDNNVQVDGDLNINFDFEG